jgi:NtrC-family two-component system sensor histidine kinase KinB
MKPKQASSINPRTQQDEGATLALLYLIASEIHTYLDLDDVLHRVLMATIGTMDTPHGSLFVFDDSGNITQRLVIKNWQVQEKEDIPVDVVVEKGLAGWVIRNQQGAVVTNTAQDERWYSRADEPPPRAAVAAPLQTRNGVIGVLTLVHDMPGYFSQSDLAMLTVIADQATTAVVNARLYQAEQRRSQLVEQLQAAEMRYTRLFEDNTDMLLIFDNDGKVLDANHKACEALHRDRESLIGSYVSALDDELHTQFDTSLPGWRAGQEIVFEVDLPVTPERITPVEFRTRRIDYGGADGIEWSGRDISSRREVEQLREDLTNMLVHDMRGPMGNLINAINTIPLVMGEMPSDSPVTQLVDIALRSGQQMQDLIDSMLDVSRLEQHEVPLNRTQAGVDALLRTVEDQLDAMARARQVELNFEVRGEAPMAWIDQDMIRRVLVNMVTNAIKYSPRHGQVDVVASEGEGCLNFSVADEGPGIPAEYQWRIFDKFARVQVKDVASGVGLGLAFCRLAVEAHGGRIWVESTPGQGSTFWFTLPLIEPSQRPYGILKESNEGAESQQR